MNLDLTILKHVLDNKVYAQDFADHYPPEMFTKDYRILAGNIIKYILAYRSSPTKRPFLDRITNQSLKDYLEEKWNELEKVTVDPNEYQYHLEQLKKRYEKVKINSIQKIIALESENTPFEKGKQVGLVLQQIQSVKEGRSYTQRTAKEHLPYFKEYIEGTKEEKQAHLIPTFYALIDGATNGLSPQELVIIAGESASGKMLALSTPIPTPLGFVDMGDIKPGDKVFGQNGKACTVMAESEVKTEKAWKLTFSDGTTIIAHDDHLWKTFTINERQKLNNSHYEGTIKATKEIVATLKSTEGRDCHSIPLCKSLDLPEKDLPLDPYFLGLWLGDRNEIYESDFQSVLQDLSLIDNKHIPSQYLWASERQRLDLLQGLIDSEDCVNNDGSLWFSNKLKSLSEGVAFLIRSLGWSCQIHQNKNFNNYTISFAQPFSAFLRITKAERVAPIPMKCIQVDSEDHLYLAGKGFVPTHNSFLLNNMATQMWLQGTQYKGSEINRGYNILFFSLEMGYQQCFDRFMARLTGVPYNNFAGTMSHEERQKVYKAMEFIEKFPYQFEIVDIPRNLTVREMELRYQESLLTHKPDVVVVDYMGLMGDANNREQDWLKLGLLAGELHEFARTYDVVMLTAAQLTDLKRGNKGEAPKSEDAAVGMHRIGRSSLIMHHANLGIQIEKRVGEDKHTDLKYHLIKNRKGPLGKGFLSKDFARGTLLDRGVEESAKNDKQSLNSVDLLAKIKELKAAGIKEED